MHIEPGVVDGAKMILSYGTAAAAAGVSLKLIADDLKQHNVLSFALRSVLAAMGTFICFEVLPHMPVGVSEVHLILGTTLLLLLGAGAAAVGLAAGLLIQGMFFAPTDLAMYTVNVTTLMFPLFLIATMTARSHKPYVEMGYGEVLKLSAAYQGGIVAWVAFWVFYGQGFGAMADVATFAASYAVVLLVEPVADLLALAAAKSLRGTKASGLMNARLYDVA